MNLALWNLLLAKSLSLTKITVLNEVTGKPNKQQHPFGRSLCLYKHLVPFFLLSFREDVICSVMYSAFNPSLLLRTSALLLLFLLYPLQKADVLEGLLSSGLSVPCNTACKMPSCLSAHTLYSICMRKSSAAWGCWGTAGLQLISTVNPFHPGLCFLICFL